jgi:hypothetical protein
MQLISLEARACGFLLPYGEVDERNLFVRGGTESLSRLIMGVFDMIDYRL